MLQHNRDGRDGSRDEWSFLYWPNMTARERPLTGNSHTHHECRQVADQRQFSRPGSLCPLQPLAKSAPGLVRGSR
jgi:hypothetical protein